MRVQKYFPGIFCILLLSYRELDAASIELKPSADTSLIEMAPTNNFGGAAFVLAGTSENLTRHRALFKFDIAAQIPAFAKIKSATLILEVTGQPANADPPPGSDFHLHRMLRPWGEGEKGSPTNCNSCVGLGLTATFGEATWNDRFAFTTNSWSVPGSTNDFDYVTASSSSQAVYDIGNSPYSFNSTELMVSDVQSWLDAPQNNFGWIFLTESENTAFTARRFGSRENNSFPPLLQIDYILPPVIQDPKISANQFEFLFQAEAGQPYVVEFRNSLSPTNLWQILTNIDSQIEATNLTIFDSRSASERYYRVVAPVN